MAMHLSLRTLTLAGFALSLQSCALVNQILLPLRNPTAQQTAEVLVVTPSFLLDGKARVWQDSLRTSLLWVQSQPLPPKWTLQHLQFANATDSTVRLEVHLFDEMRYASGRLSRDSVQSQVRSRVQRTLPVFASLQQAKLTGVVRLRVEYKSRDFLNQASRWQRDSVWFDTTIAM